MSNPIKVFGEIKKVDEKTVELELSTKFRIELAAILVLSLGFPVAALNIEEPLPLWLFALSPVCFLFFWMIYHAQEANLIELIKSHLDLKEEKDAK
ncbi:MAG: hypothetical protein R3B47_03740 [Bacteroidia bacterium]